MNVNQDTNSSAINFKPMDTIASALNVTQGHKRSYQISSYAINAKTENMISSALNVSHGHKLSHQTISYAINTKSQDTFSARMFQRGRNYF